MDRPARGFLPSFPQALLPALLLPLLWAAVAGEARGEIYRPDDPLVVDRDDLPSPRPAGRDLSFLYELVVQSVTRSPRPGPPALNANTLGEVPDSSWFTNRIGSRPMSDDEVFRGATTGPGPAPGTWQVVEAKSEGLSPGFWIEDSAGVRYLLKFDPPGYPEMHTGAEAIGSRFFHAIGYHVPENTIVRFARSDLTVSGEAKLKSGGKERPLTSRMIDVLLSPFPRDREGKYRAVASKRLPGKPIGSFRFESTRGDDPNDVIAHEHRRELRGYRVFSAWLNHDDSRAANTLDLYIGEDGAGHVRHHLIDFGSTLGSGTSDAEEPSGGYEYYLDPPKIPRNLVTLGLGSPPWAKAHYPDFPAVGRIEAERFDPARWKPNYPNPAFGRMDDQDAFWAARIVASFGDGAIRAAVRAGEISDPAAEEYLVRCLIERRQKVARAWLTRVGSLDRFRIEGDALRFEDARVRAGLEPVLPAVTAEVLWLNQISGTRRVLAPARAVPAGQVELGSEVTGAPAGSYFAVVLGARGQTVEVVLRRDDAGLAVVGVQR